MGGRGPRRRDQERVLFQCAVQRVEVQGGRWGGSGRAALRNTAIAHAEPATKCAPNTVAGEAHWDILAAFQLAIHIFPFGNADSALWSANLAAQTCLRTIG